MKRPKKRKVHMMDTSAEPRKPFCGARAKTMYLAPSKVTCAACNRLFNEKVANFRRKKRPTQ